MTYILCLAHYCEQHGPTPLMVTEGLSTPCSVCPEDSATSSIRRGSSAGRQVSKEASEMVSNALNHLNIGSSAPSSTSDPSTGPRRPALRPSVIGRPEHASRPALETPPGSPLQSSAPNRDSSFQRTYDEAVTRNQVPCDNCAMTLPAYLKNSNTSRGPMLRSRAPTAKVFFQGFQSSPPNSQSSSDSDAENESAGQTRSNNGPPRPSRTTSQSSTSSSSDRRSSHMHYLDYTSTHEPLLNDSFSLLRNSCIRTLYFETLPRAPSTGGPTSPQQPTSPAFVTTQSAGSAVSGGPIFFGDASAGYTTAYIFRIPDVHARGRKRIYAFLALSTHQERLAMKTFATISTAFRELATWVQQLAEAEAERASAESPIMGAGGPPSFPLHAGMGGGFPTQRQPSAFDTAAADRGGSSFLTGGGGFSRRSMAGGPRVVGPKARGLAELVGNPDFFVELHSHFVHLSCEVGVTLGV